MVLVPTVMCGVTLSFNFLVYLVLWVDHHWFFIHRYLLAVPYESSFNKDKVIMTYQNDITKDVCLVRKVVGL